MERRRASEQSTKADARQVAFPAQLTQFHLKERQNIMLETRNRPAPQQITAAWPKRFRDKLDTSAGPDGCWPWTACQGSNGYGQFWLAGKTRPAHRVAYELVNGDISDRLHVDHICHNRRCVNPAHVRLATNKENLENRSGATIRSESGIRGAYKYGDRWRAQVRHHGEAIYLGMFASAEEAGEVARRKRLELFTHSDVDRRVSA